MICIIFGFKQVYHGAHSLHFKYAFYTNEMRTYITHAIRKFAQRNATLIELDRRVTYNMVKAMRGRRLNPLCCTLSFAAVVYIPPFNI